MWDLIFLAIFFYLLFQYFIHLIPSKTKPPGPFPFPIIGNIPQLVMTGESLPYKALHKLTKKYGPIMTIQTGTIEQVVVSDYEDFTQILGKDIASDRFCYQPAIERSGPNAASLGILIANGTPWRVTRRFCTQTLREFGFGKKHFMEGVIKQEMKELLDKMRSAACSGTPFRIDLSFIPPLVNIIWAMVTGKRFEEDDPKEKELIAVNVEINRTLSDIINDFTVAFPMLRKYVPWISNRAALEACFKSADNLAQGLLNEYKATKGQREEPTFVDLFLQKIKEDDKHENGQKIFTEKQFVTSFLDMFIAGSDTLNGTLSYAILFMLLHPEKQERVHLELDQVVGEGEEVRLEHRERMLYTQAVLQESMRLGIIVPIIPPRAFTRDFQYKGYNFKKGLQITPNYYSITRDEKLWGPDTESFRPERFLNEEETMLINLDKVAPFGFGKRFCMGEPLATPAMFLIFAMILKEFELHLVPGTKEPTPIPQQSFTATPYPFDIIFRQRQSAV